MFAKERQDKIYELILKNNAVTVANLVESFHVSIETIRRDLLEMERQGLLTRVHGGAVVKNEMKHFLKLNERNKECSEQKRNLSLKAVQFICEGDLIAVDSGSTAILFAEALKEKFSKLTIVTHSLDVFNILNGYKNFSLILCGGNYLESENAFCGPLTLNMLGLIHVQKAFIFPSAISLEYGICDYQQELYQVQKGFLSCADEVFVLADGSKFQKTALLKLDDMKNDYIYITDSGLAKELKQLYKENDIKIYTEED